MSRATHADPAALVAACVIATSASWALENASPSMLLEAAAEEARQAAQAVTTEARLAEMLAQVSAGTWQPPASGISPDPYETVAAALWRATRATSLRSGLVGAVQLGGDTDTVAALVGGLMGCKLTPVAVTDGGGAADVCRASIRTFCTCTGSNERRRSRGVPAHLYRGWRPVR